MVVWIALAQNWTVLIFFKYWWLLMTTRPRCPPNSFKILIFVPVRWITCCEWSSKLEHGWIGRSRTPTGSYTLPEFRSGFEKPSKDAKVCWDERLWEEDIPEHGQWTNNWENENGRERRSGAIIFNIFCLTFSGKKQNTFFTA